MKKQYFLIEQNSIKELNMAKTRQEINKTYDEKRKNSRGRYWSIIVYPDDLPESWRDAFVGMKWIESPVHDKDVNSDGTRKKPHIHLIFMFTNHKSKKSIEDFLLERFTIDENGSIAGIAKNPIIVELNSYTRYLAHMDNPEKFRYDENLIVGHGGADVSRYIMKGLTLEEEYIKLQEIEDLIRTKRITEYCDLCYELRDYPVLMNVFHSNGNRRNHIKDFIRSFRHSIQNERIDLETGEILEGSL